MQIAHKNIILTGAASGIGRVLLNQLVNFEGVRILAVDLHNVECTSEKVLHYTCDLSQQTEIDKMFAFAVTQFQTIDIFIANAGFAYYEQISQPD
jgi:NAD(P)-dependent dehydrogenase (short-subunit alcohol dehydrogenase family)